MKRFKSEKAFTLVEMSVVLSVVALIGSLLVGGVVAANNNRVSAGVLEFFDKEIEQANENFKLDPQPVLSNQGVLPEPYQNMHYSNLTGSVPGFQYAGFYTEDLISQGGASTDTPKYMLLISFEQEAATEEEVEGFQRNLTSYQMKAQVIEMVEGAYDYDHPLLERVYKGIAVEGQVDWSKDKNIEVTYRVDDPDEQPATIQNYTTGESGENVLTAKFASGDQFYSQKVTVTKNGSGKTFVGWASAPNSREVIPSGTKITSDMVVYAIFAEYRLEFQLQQGQQFDPDVIAPPANEKNYFIERDFDDFPNGQTTIGDIPETEDQSHVVETLLGVPESQVIQAGYEFKGWRNAVTKENISESLGGKGLKTVLTKENPYLQLEAVMEKIEADETMPLKLSLDLSNYIADGRKFFLYGITELEYKVTYDKETKILGLMQTEYNTWKGEKKVVSEQSFKLGDGHLSIVDEDGNAHTNFEEYFTGLMSSGKDKYIVLDSVQLTVKAPTFDSSTYRNATGATKAEVLYNGVKLTTQEIESLDASSGFSVDDIKYQSKTLDGNETTLPMDEESWKDLNSQLLSWYGEHKDTYAQVELFNVSGGFTHSDSNEISVYETKDTETVTTTKNRMIGSREISFRVVVPISLIDYGAHKVDKENYTIKFREGVDKDGNIFLQIDGLSKPTYSTGSYTNLYRYSMTSGYWETIYTGIPYKETYTDSNGTYTIYNRISTVDAIGDISESHYTIVPEVAIVPGNGPTEDGWFPKETGLNKVYDDNGVKIKAVEVKWLGDLKAKEIEGGYCAGINRDYCKPYGYGSGYHLQLNRGLYDVRPVPETNYLLPDSIYILSSSYDDSITQDDINWGRKIPYVAYDGEKYWESNSSLKAALKNNLTAKGGDGSTFDKIWSQTTKKQIMIGSNTTYQSTDTIHVTRYSFNFNDGSSSYTSLPANFVCK